MPEALFEEKKVDRHVTVLKLVRDESRPAYDRFNLDEIEPFSEQVLKSNNDPQLAFKIIQAHEIADDLEMPLAFSEIKDWLQLPSGEYRRKLKNHLWTQKIKLQVQNHLMEKGTVEDKSKASNALEEALSDESLHRLFEGLSPRARNVAYLAAFGFDRKRIRQVMKIGEKTASTYCSNVIRSIGTTVRDRLEVKQLPVPRSNSNVTGWINAWRQATNRDQPLKRLVEHPLLQLGEDQQSTAWGQLVGQSHEISGNNVNRAQKTSKGHTKTIKTALGSWLEVHGFPRIGFERLSSFLTFVAYLCPPTRNGSAHRDSESWKPDGARSPSRRAPLDAGLVTPQAKVDRLARRIREREDAIRSVLETLRKHEHATTQESRLKGTQVKALRTRLIKLMFPLDTLKKRLEEWKRQARQDRIPTSS